jgi:uncharacterized protein YdeI (YjbR/CyaY-like superfamily)
VATRTPDWRRLAEAGEEEAMKKKSTGVSEEIRLFATPATWLTWLEKNHGKSSGLWLRLAKKGSIAKSVTYGEALEVALCYGWIDGQKRGESDEAWLQRFLPRSARSIWSKINREKAIALIACGKMKPAGQEAIAAAKRNGTWDAAYDSQKSIQIPKDFQAALNTSSKAHDFFRQLDSANRYAVLFRIQIAKKLETRERKIREFVQMLEKGQRIHEPRKVHPKPKSK